MLGYAAAKIADDQIRMPIVENLWEEHGEGDITRSHRQLYINFLRSLNLSEQQIETSAPSTATAAGTPKPSSRPNIYDRPLNKTRTAEVSASAFAFLFSETVQYMQKRVSGINDLERRYVQTITLTCFISG